MHVLYKDMRHAENNKYYVSIMFTNVLEHNNNVKELKVRQYDTETKKWEHIKIIGNVWSKKDEA